MPFETDERLKSYLDTNQLGREQMCLAILALDKRFTNVRPRHPRGGPDGGRDIEAVFRKEHLAYGAVGFVNQLWFWSGFSGFPHFTPATETVSSR